MKKTGSDFIRPYAKEHLGSDKVTHYAYPREELIANPMFPYFVFDGGAFNFANDRLGITDGDGILDLTMSGKLWDVFTLDGKFNWERSFAQRKDLPVYFTPKYEWQIWPQRLYMIIPVAQAFLRTGDKKYSDKWLEIVKNWDENHPYQPFDPNIHYIKTDMTWRDMQVAWRTLSLMHSMFMLQDAPYTKEEWKYLYDFLALHVKHMYVEALDRLEKNHQQNHVLQIGVALIMACTMFPEFENSEEMLKSGIDTVVMNMGAVYKDGGSNEDSPSYSHFIVRLYLEAYLLLKNNGLTIPDGLKECIDAQYNWMWQCSAPDGKVMRFSDSYSFDSFADIERAKKLYDMKLDGDRRSVFFPDSHVGVIREGKHLLAVDAMDEYGGHRHTGRPQTLLWFNDQPILIDTGCSNYDLWDFYRYVNSYEAHNVVYCPEFDYVGVNQHCNIVSYDKENKVICTESTVSCNGKSYKWERKVSIVGNNVVFEDHAVADTELDWECRFHLTREQTSTISANEVAQMNDRYLLVIKCDGVLSHTLTPILNDNNKVDFSNCFITKGHGKEFNLKTVFELTER